MTVGLSGVISERVGAVPMQYLAVNEIVRKLQECIDWTISGSTTGAKSMPAGKQRDGRTHSNTSIKHKHRKTETHKLINSRTPQSQSTVE
jgi:hypothetical protein